MKKLLSVLLALAMVLCMGVAVFADEPTVEPEEELNYVTSVDLQKMYTATNPNTTSPAEDFTFTITRESVAHSPVAKDDMPMFGADPAAESYTATISFAAGGATTAGATQSTTLTLPEYSAVGVYTYKIVETVGATAGVEYDDQPMYLVVTVVQDATGRKYVAALHYGAATGDNKDEYFQNTYSAGDLKVTKEVTGKLGDVDKFFKVTVTLTGVSGKTYQPSYAIETNQPTYVDAAGKTQNNPTTAVVGQSFDFYVKNGTELTIKNLPYDVTYTVEEADYSGDGYTTTTTYSDATNKKIDSALDTVAIVNDKDPGVDTGISFDSLPYILLMAGSLVGLVVLAAKRRSSED